MADNLAQKLVAKTISRTAEEGFYHMIISGSLMSMVYKIPNSTPVDAQTIAVAYANIRRRLESHIGWGAVTINIRQAADGCTITLGRHVGLPRA